MPEAVVDRLFLEDHVEDVAARTEVAAQGFGHRAAGSAANLAVGLAQQRERLVEREILPVDVDANARTKLFEQPDPGRVAYRAEVGEHALFGLGELVRAILARLLDRVAIGRGFGIREEICRVLIADLRELEQEEHHVAAALGAGLTYAGEQAARGMVLRVLAVQ